MIGKKDVQVNIRVCPEFLAEIDAAAENERCTRTEYIRRSCREKIDRDSGEEFRRIVGFLQSLYGNNRSYAVSEPGRLYSGQKKDGETFGPEDVLREIANLLKYLEGEGRISRK